MIRLPRDPARHRALAIRRAEQVTRSFGFEVSCGVEIKKPNKAREYPSLRGDKKRAHRDNLIASSLTDQGRVLNAWSRARLRNWNGPGKLKGGAKAIDWTAELAELRKWGRAA